jgi:TetR/AcrR family transcriptional regulator, fatty acid metabolism regulator protein
MASSVESKALRRPSVRLPQEKRVADIMAAARQVLAEKGYENALMSDIAERAGIVEGSLYRYFDNKRDLLTKVADDWFEEVLSTDSGVASIRGTWNKVRHLTWRALSAVRNQPALSRYMLLEIRRDPDYRNTRSFSLNRRFTGEFTEVFEEAIASGEFRRDVSVPLLRDMVFGCIEHSTWKFLRGEGDFSLEEVSDGIANLVVRGMTAESAPAVATLQLNAVAARLEKAASDLEVLLRHKRT